MAGTDIVFFYTDPRTGEDYYGVRDLFNAWVAAGRPPINSAGRLYAVQKAARLAYLNGTGSPADDPDQPGSYELGHCRFGALDIDATPERVRALSAAGLVRPFSWESWHWRLQNIYNYPIVHSIPSSAGDGSTPFPEDDMFSNDDRSTLLAIQLMLGAGGLQPGGIRDDDTISHRLRRVEAQLSNLLDGTGTNGASDAKLADAETILGVVRGIRDGIADLPKA